MLVESSGGFVLRIDDDAGHCEHCAGLRHSLAGFGKQDRSQALALKVHVDGKSSDESDGHGIAWQFAREQFGQLGAFHAARTQSEKTGQAPRIALRRGYEDPRNVTPDVLRSVATDVIVKRLPAALKGRRFNDCVKRPDVISGHRRTDAACRLKARLRAAFGLTGASIAARNA